MNKEQLIITLINTLYLFDHTKFNEISIQKAAQGHGMVIVLGPLVGLITYIATYILSGTL